MTAGAQAPVQTTPAPPAPPAGWLWSPVYDLLLISALAWIPIALTVSLVGTEHQLTRSMSLVNLFFLNTPHRWFTFVLVFLDRRVYESRPGFFNGWMATYIALVSACYVITGSFELAILGIFLWNKWHFAAQHHGILRIYAGRAGRKQDAGALWRERWLLRGLVMYAGMRIMAYSTLPTAGESLFATVFGWVDYLALLVPVFLLGRELALGVSQAAVGRIVYLSSVCALYGGIVLAAHLEIATMVSGLVMASAFFHSVEYLAICHWSLERKHRQPEGIWTAIMPRLGVLMLVFMLVLFVSGLTLTTLVAPVWVFINLVVGFCHFTYDAVIWRKPAKRATPPAA